MEIEDILRNGEGQKVDFKLRVDNQTRIARTLCALANSDGGSIYIGVKDNGKVAGCEPSEEFHNISAAADLYTEPIIAFESKVHQVKHKLVLEVMVPKSYVIHQSLDVENEWHTYIRIDDVSLEANPVLNKVLLMRHAARKFDAESHPEMQTIVEAVCAEEKVSFSKLLKLTGLKHSQVEDGLAGCVYLGLIQYELDDVGVVYGIKIV